MAPLNSATLDIWRYQVLWLLTSFYTGEGKNEKK